MIHKLDQLSELDKQILEASREEFQNFGYHKANVDDIAARLKIGKGTIYRHFVSKPMLFVSVIVYLLKEGQRMLEAGEEIQDFHQGLEYYINKVFEFRKVAGSFVSVFFSEDNYKIIKEEMHKDGMGAEMFKFIKKTHNDSIQVLSKLLLKGVEQNLIPRYNNVRLIAEIIFVTINSFFMNHHMISEAREETLENEQTSSEEDMKELKGFIYRGIGIQNR